MLKLQKVIWNGGKKTKTKTNQKQIKSDLTPVKNRLVPAGAQMSAWLVNDGCGKYIYFSELGGGGG